jgi:hypothetical protein
VPQVVEHFPSKRKTLGSKPSIEKETKPKTNQK